MKYLEFTFEVTPNEEYIKDVLTSVLCDLGFESFVTEDVCLKAYIQKEKFNEDLLKQSILDFPLNNDLDINYTYIHVEDKNWNEEWEKNYFKPVVISNKCVVHSTFHTDIPKCEYDIVINPQMAFGTGHHETTSLILQYLIEEDITEKKVIDMGCGTSVLAIMARMRGANKCFAIDIDDWCVRNSLENIQLNNMTNIQVLHGDANMLGEVDSCDVFIANINRNILIADMHKYVEKMLNSSVLYMSGFYKEDIHIIEEEASKYGLVLESHKEKNNWIATKFVFKI